MSVLRVPEDRNRSIEERESLFGILYRGKIFDIRWRYVSQLCHKGRRRTRVATDNGGGGSRAHGLGYPGNGLGYPGYGLSHTCLSSRATTWRARSAVSAAAADWPACAELARRLQLSARHASMPRIASSRTHDPTSPVT
eukprot:4677137-Pyramimonas_sp.AAC.2